MQLGVSPAVGSLASISRPKFVDMGLWSKQFHGTPSLMAFMSGGWPPDGIGANRYRTGHHSRAGRVMRGSLLAVQVDQLRFARRSLNFFRNRLVFDFLAHHQFWQKVEHLKAHRKERAA
jgi:hypothetical protein